VIREQGIFYERHVAKRKNQKPQKKKAPQGARIGGKGKQGGKDGTQPLAKERSNEGYLR
jgi:hypothetical protein